MQAQDAVVRQDRVGTVAVLVLANPPVNALSDAVRAGLAAGLSAALADPGVTAIVIRGEGRGFSAGADISEFGRVRPAANPAPGLGDLCLAVENAGKPVIAAIHGMALGGGLELALAAHYRVANAAAVLGLPEVNLGLVPGAGGTQRLPRLIGAAAALRMMLTGVPLTAADGATLGLIDRLAGADMTEAALALAREGPPPRPTGAGRAGLLDARLYLAAVAEARLAQAASRLPAPSRIVDCVEAALLFPLAQGLQAEAAAFADLVATPEAAGLRHAFFTERRAVQLPVAAAAITVKPVTTLGLWGTGEGVVDLTCQALTSGLRVMLAAPDRPALVAALEAVAAWQDAAVLAGHLTAAARDADWARLVSATSPAPLDGVDMIVTTAGAAPMPQDLGLVASAVLGTARDIEQSNPAQPTPTLPTPTLSNPALPIPTLPILSVPAPSVSGRPGGLAELGLSRAAPPEAIARLAALARRLSWRLVLVGPGAVVELGLRQALAAALDHLASEGIPPAVVSAALARWSSSRLAEEGPVDGGIIAVCLAALGAEGARMLQDGRARRPLEVDAVAMMSGLVPRWDGGPMFQADLRGLLLLRQDLMARAGRAAVFVPPVLIDRLIADGQTFASLNLAKA